MKIRLRNILKEFEAHIHPVQADSKIPGKSEWKHYDDGTYRIKASIRNIPLPEDSRIDLMLDDVRIMQLTVKNNKAKADLESPIQVGIPKVKPGQVLRVTFGESVLAEGKYEAE